MYLPGAIKQLEGQLIPRVARRFYLDLNGLSSANLDHSSISSGKQLPLQWLEL